MTWFRRQTDAERERRSECMTDFERLIKRTLAIPLAAPVLLFLGFGVGKLTTKAIQLPESAPVRTPSHFVQVPRFQLERISSSMSLLRKDGDSTVNYVSMYRDHIAPVEDALLRRGVPHTTARKVAWPLVEHAYARGLSPATVLSVLLIESEGKPTARSSVGARGLMQVMPFWAGQFRACGKDLYNIEDNLCNGTRILASYVHDAGGDERRALLGYNGCVHGTNTPNCHIYPDKIQRLRAKIESELLSNKKKASLLTGAE
jgi:hypothetical protein